MIIGPKLRIVRRLGKLVALTRKKPLHRIHKTFIYCKNKQLLNDVLLPEQKRRIQQQSKQNSLLDAVLSKNPKDIKQISNNDKYTNKTRTQPIVYKPGSNNFIDFVKENKHVPKEKQNQRNFTRKELIIIKPPGQHGLSSLLKRKGKKNSISKHLISLKIKQRLKYYYHVKEKQLLSYIKKIKISNTLLRLKTSNNTDSKLLDPFVLLRSNRNNVVLSKNPKVLKGTNKVSIDCSWLSVAPQKNSNDKVDTKGDKLLKTLEMRLDNIVFRLYMAPSIAAARQYIMHGHVLVNNKRKNIPSYLCKPSDVISINCFKKTNQKQKVFHLINKNMDVSMSLLLSQSDKGICLRSSYHEVI
jgi:ribosomal protein S4